MNQNFEKNRDNLQEIIKPSQRGNGKEQRKKGLEDKVNDGLWKDVQAISGIQSSSKLKPQDIETLKQNLQSISMHMLDIFKKEPLPNLGNYGYQQDSQNMIEETEGFQLSYLGKLFTKECSVPKNTDIIIEMNNESIDFIQKSIDPSLNEKQSQNFINNYRNTNSLFNSSIDKLLQCIEEKKNIEQIIQERLKLQNQLSDNFVQQREDALVDGYLNSAEDEGIKRQEQSAGIYPSHDDDDVDDDDDDIHM